MDIRQVTRTQSSPPKQRRGSLPASPSLNAVAGWGFRDEMGLPSSGVNGEHFLHGRSHSMGGVSLQSSEEPGAKRARKKWTHEETQMLVDGCNAHGVGNWKAILNDPKLTFDPGRTPVDLKDRFRTYFPDAYRQHYPNARTHLSDKIRSALPNGGSIFEKTRTKRRRPFSPEEDDALRRGYEKHGTLWAQIVQDPIFQSQHRRSTDLRDRFRNAFPDLYEAAGYKPRTPSKKMLSASHSARSVDSSTKPEHARLRAARRRLTYPGMAHCGKATPASDSVDYSSAEEDAHPQHTDQAGPCHPTVSHPKLTRHASTLSTTSDAFRHNIDSSQNFVRRSSSPRLEHDTVSLSSQSHMLSGPASPSSPRRHLALPDTMPLDEDDAKASWNELDWLASSSQAHLSHAPLTASSLFSANMFGSYNSSSPRHDVLDRYDLYSSPLSSSANTFGDYLSEMGIGGSLSEADMDLNAFSGPASSMGFTHHSHVAGDLIFASHHGGHLHHGHGFSLYDQNRLPYNASVPAIDPSQQQVDSTLGLSNVPFGTDTSTLDHRGQFDPHALDPMLNLENVSLTLMGQASRDMANIPDVFASAFAVSPGELTRPPSSQPLGEPLTAPITSSPAGTLQPGSQHLPSTFLATTISDAKVFNAPSSSGVARRASLSPSPNLHLRSASQPPTDQRLVDARRNVLPSFGLALSPPTSTRDDLMQDLWHRGSESYQLPFLDLHYYGVSESHAASAPQGRDAH